MHHSAHLKHISPRFLLLLGASSIFLTGCIKIDIHENVRTDLTIEQEILFDVSALMSLTEGLQEVSDDVGEDAEETSSMEEGMSSTSICKDFSVENDDRIQWIGSPRCTTITASVARIHGVLRLKNKALTKIKQKNGNMVYRYNMYLATQDEKLGGASADEVPSADSSLTDQMVTYTITMPGKITKFDVGKLFSPDSVRLTSDDLKQIKESRRGTIESTVDVPISRSTLKRQGGSYIHPRLGTTAKEEVRSRTSIRSGKVTERIMHRRR